MAPLVRRSIPGTLLLVACFLAAAAVPVAAQHPRISGGGAHLSTPVSHPPVSQPVFRAPMPGARITGGVGVGGMNGFRPPRRPVRPFPPLWGWYALPLAPANGLWQLNSCWWANCELFWVLGYNQEPAYTSAPVNYVAVPEYEPPVYGESRDDFPQLYLKDGTVLNVSDYWVVDGQLHFTMVEQYGAKPVEHVIAFDALDVQSSIDANGRRGFRFILRNEPVEQYMRDHPDEVPPEPVVPHP